MPLETLKNLTLPRSESVYDENIFLTCVACDWNNSTLSLQVILVEDYTIFSVFLWSTISSGTTGTISQLNALIELLPKPQLFIWTIIQKWCELCLRFQAHCIYQTLAQMGTQ